MPATLWERDGALLVDQSGRPIECDECPECCEDLECPALPDITLTISGAPDANLDGSWGLEDGNPHQSTWDDGTWEYLRTIELLCPYSGNGLWTVTLQVRKRACCGSGDYSTVFKYWYTRSYTDGTTCDASGDYTCLYYQPEVPEMFRCTEGSTISVTVELGL